jgi:hypothetical protein
MASLTKEQRDALWKLLYAVGPGVHYTKEIDEATKEIANAFADALRPPKMATKVHAAEPGQRWRVVRDSDGSEWLEYRSIAVGIAPSRWERSPHSAVLLAAARDTEFHEVED